MKFRFRPNQSLLVSLSIIELFALFLIFPILRSGLPPGIDTPSHLFSSWFLTKSLEAGIIPATNPYWYAGQPFGVYYPPLPYYSVSFLALILGNVTLSYKILVVLFFLLTPLTVYLVSKEFGLDKKGAVVSTFLFTSSYAYISNITVMGRFTTQFALPFFMFSIYFLLRLKTGSLKNAMFGGISLGILLLSHQLTAYAFAIFCAIYVLTVALPFFRNKDVALFRNLAIMAAVSIVISSWWLIPLLIHINDIGFQRSIPGGYWFTMSFFWHQIFNPNNINTRIYPLYVGYSTVLLSSIGVISLLAKRKFMLVIFTASMVLISLGTNLKIYYYLPYSNNLDVARFFLYGVLMLSILCGFGFAKLLELSKNRVLVIVLVVLILLIPTGVSLRSRAPMETWQIDQSLTQTFEWLKSRGEPGRVYGIGLEFWDSYLLPVYADRQIIDGWLHESAKNWRDIRLLDDMEWGLKPIDIEAYYGILKKYDAKYVVLGNHLGDRYFPKYEFPYYEEYVKDFQTSRHFREEARFGNVIIFEVVSNE